MSGLSIVDLLRLVLLGLAAGTLAPLAAARIHARLHRLRVPADRRSAGASGGVPSLGAEDAPTARPRAAQFLLREGRLMPLDAEARALITGAEAADQARQALAARLSPQLPDIDACLQMLAERPGPLTLTGEAEGMTVELVARPEGQRDLRLTVTFTEFADQLVLMPRTKLAEDTAELQRLRMAVEATPILVWEEDERGRVVWGNRAYRELAEAEDPHKPPQVWPLPRLMEPAGAPPFEAGPVRVPVKLKARGGVAWFTLWSHATPNGNGVIRFAADADATVRAEQALREFVQTLTKTFAQLPIGLAMFDAKGRLAVFNPALVELTTLDAAWLSTRPTMAEFLDRLRERRMIPEPRDYAAWRAEMAAIGRPGGPPYMQENWPLPGGQTFRVTGRALPEGAVAFLVEDITSEVALRRRFRAELALGQATLDALDEAIAVFDGSGTLALTNEAFAQLFGFAADETVAPLDVAEATARMAARFHPSPAWGDLRDFARIPASRAPWQATLKTRVGRVVEAAFRPLPAGATLCRFTPADPAVAWVEAPAASEASAGSNG